MAEEIGIVMSLYDKVSPTLKGIGNNTKAFDKDLQELEQACKAYEKSQESLNKDISTLKSKLTESNDKVKEATKAWRGNKNELTKGVLNKAIEEQQEYKAKLKDTEAALNSQRKAVVGLAGEVRKTSNSSAGDTGGVGGLMDGLKRAGVFKLFSDSLFGMIGAGLESAIGVPTAKLASGIVSGVMSGAAMGSVIPGLGTVAGAVLGGASGLISGGTQIFQAKDDTFKGYVQEQAEGQISQRDSDIQSGSAVAAGREQKQLVFTTLLESKDAATDFLAELKTMAANTNYTYDEITGYAKSMVKPFGADKSQEILTALSDTSAALSLNESDNAVLIAGLSRMKLTDETTQEYLNYFSERGIDVYAALSKWGDAATVAETVTGGKIKGSEAVEEILAYMKGQYSGLSEEMAGTYEGMVGNLADAQTNAQEAYGIGYNEARKQGIADQTKWLASGTMDEANRAIGAWQAGLENAKEKYVRDAVDAAMETDEYQQAKAAGDAAEMGCIIMQAKVHGMGEYNANEGKDEALAAELALAKGIRDDAQSNEAYWDAGYRKSQEYSKGLAAGLSNALQSAFGLAPFQGGEAPELVKKNVDSMGFVPLSLQSGFGITGGTSAADFVGSSNAYGLNRVPYDDFPALLHEGERVLTAQEARQADRGGGAPVIQVTVTGNSFVDQDMEDRVARKVGREVQRAILLAQP